MNALLTSYLPMLILGLGALAVFVCGALSPTRGTLFRSIALLASGAACLSALAMVPDATQTLVDAGPYARFFTALLCGVAFVCLLFAGEYARLRGFERDEFHALILLATLGMVMLAVSTDWIMFAIALEILSLSLYVLIASRREKSLPLEAAIKYFVLGAVASSMVFFGIALVYAASGSMDLAASLVKSGTQGTGLLGMAFILIGLGFKLSLAPMHLWTPDVYQGAPAPVAAFLSGGAKVAAFAALLRLAMTQSPVWTAVEPALWALTALSLVGGTLGALTQPSAKRMLAYSSVTHVGFMVLALLAVGTAGPGPAMFAAAALAVMDVAVFGCLGLLSPIDQDADLVDGLRGLGRSQPGVAGVLALSLLTLGGLPPTIGFMSKLVVFKAALAAGYLWLSVIAVAMAIVGVFYILRVLAALYAEPDENAPLPVLAAPGASGWLAVAISALLMIGLGVAPMPVLDAAALAFKTIP
ncbi:NADH-quinone oxidoreductase subunit N [Fundidesulfovibrio terrae]|uniref:NADH-quinone oxidoreductase subunit N n=1 Tax=Fundidesulfovibrio terrae TaxID=2922866 RepID=UPI001FAE8A35|nr:NADH-quinone oxidoreductase subunit N [Fundidesulfovibrio terrae]